MKSTEMANESNVINMRNQRSSGRPSVAAKMSQLANNSGDISYDSVLRIVGDEIDAEKKSKMLLRTSLLLLFSLLALTAANAGLTFAVVEFAKDTTMDGSVMTTKAGETVKVGSVDFYLENGKMMAVGGNSPTPVATAQGMKELDQDELLTAASFDISVLDAVESVVISEGSDRSMQVTGYEINEDYSGVTFETASGVTVFINNEGDMEVEDKTNSRSLLKKPLPSFDAKVSLTSDKGGPKSFFRIKELPEEHKDGLFRSVMETTQLRPARERKQRKNDHAGDFMKTVMAAIVKDKVRADPGRGSIAKESFKTFDFAESNAQFHEASATWTYSGSGYGSGRRHLAQYSFRSAMPSWTMSLPAAPAYPCHNNDAMGYYCEYVDAMSFLGYSDLGVTLNPNGTNYLTDMWGWSKNGRDFVIQGTTNSVHFVEITDGNNPDVIGTHDLDGHDRLNMSWSNPTYNIIADIKTIGDMIYIVSWRKNSSVMKMNANQLLTAAMGTNFVTPTHLSAHIACCYPGLWNINWDKYIAAHNIVGFENLVLGFWVSPTWSGGNFSCYPGDSGVMILDAADPSNQVGCIGEVSRNWFAPFGTPGALPGGQGVGGAHDGACHNYGSSQICFLAGGYSGKLSAVNVTPVVNNFSIALIVDHQVTVPGYVLTHQIALDSVGGFMLVTDEFDEAWAAARNHPINMRIFAYHYNAAAGGFALANTINTGRQNTRDHQGYIYDDFYFLAAVQAGVIIYEITDKPAGIFNERGWYDSSPGAPSLSMFGAWSVYAFPYQRCNGNTYYKTAIADMGGLHVVQPQFHTGSSTNCCQNCMPAKFKYSGYGGASGYGSGSGYWSW